jgi:hypothetical protein
LVFTAGPTGESPRADDRNHFVELLAQRLAVLHQPLPLLGRQPQAGGQLFAIDLVLFLLELNDFGQFALGELGQPLQKGDVNLVARSHRAKIRKSLIASKMTMILYTAVASTSRPYRPSSRKAITSRRAAIAARR